jgi:hypothetical protein
MRLIVTVRSAKMPRMGLLERLRDWFGGGTDREEMSDAAFGGAPAGAGMGHHHPASETLPDDDRGADGGAPSHEDPLKPQVP